MQRKNPAFYFCAIFLHSFKCCFLSAMQTGMPRLRYQRSPLATLAHDRILDESTIVIHIETEHRERKLLRISSTVRVTRVCSRTTIAAAAVQPEAMSVSTKL
jgi:hypothetical protein